MVMMHTGKVLIVLGLVAASWVNACGIPRPGSVTLVPNPYYNLFCAGISQLADGRILVVGGYDSGRSCGQREHLRSVTQSWSPVPNMAYRRWYPTSRRSPMAARSSLGAQHV